jgi:maltooligosyltrehalose trehalohydrolase
MEKDDRGYWSCELPAAAPGCAYLYRLDESLERPDPASFFQPYGVHGPSVVIDHAFPWHDRDWTGINARNMALYELHVGTFSPEGVFGGVIDRLGELRALGVNAVELMPVGQFPGARAWGYEGVYPFAVQDSYGGPYELKRLVDACHALGLAVVLDVVYNHLGPEGNYLADFGPYFTDAHRTLWGMAVNFDGPYSDEVRNFFIENALHWFGRYHIDALRLDAIHCIFDRSAAPFLAELAQRTARFSEETGRRFSLIAESDLNDAGVVKPGRLGGVGLDAQWSDDFHHSLHSLLTGERNGYYVDFGAVADLAKAIKEAFVYQGRYSAYRKRRHGNATEGVPAEKFVVFCQNHDQTGNRGNGERLAALVPFEALKLAAGVLLTAPYVPLLFMGEEYGEDRPFLYFTDCGDPDLASAVRAGRKEELKAFGWEREPPDPLDAGTFAASKIEWEKRRTGRGKVLCDYFRRMFSLRRQIACLALPDNCRLQVYASEADRLIGARRWNEGISVLWLGNLEGAAKPLTIPVPEGSWIKVLDSSDAMWGGAGCLLPDRLRGVAWPESSIGAYGFALFVADGSG